MIQIFDDWLQAVADLLVQLPTHARARRETGRLAADPPAMRERFETLHRRYYGQYQEPFGRAFVLLLESTQHGLMDVLGETYMQWEIGNARAGQYFTPLDVAAMMVRMEIDDGAALVHQRIKEAARRTPLGQAMLIASLANPDADACRVFFFDRLLPAIAPDVDPITICDPCCGSGIMLLAAASRFPQWAFPFGLVRLYGQDIDATCVLMCRINLAIYGLGSPIESEMPDRPTVPVATGEPAPRPALIQVEAAREEGGAGSQLSLW